VHMHVQGALKTYFEQTASVNDNLDNELPPDVMNLVEISLHQDIWVGGGQSCAAERHLDKVAIEENDAV
jgi:hypothetical protein